jgi:hypothetical protein
MGKEKALLNRSKSTAPRNCRFRSRDPPREFLYQFSMPRFYTGETQSGVVTAVGQLTIVSPGQGVNNRHAARSRERCNSPPSEIDKLAKAPPLPRSTTESSA